MTVRDYRSAERMLGGRSKAMALLELRQGPGTLAELGRRSAVSKSSLRAALGQLEAASAIRRTDGRFELTEAGETIVNGLIALDRPTGGTHLPLAAHAGKWVALDSHEQVIAAFEDPRSLVADLRSRGILAKAIIRVPAGGQRFEGSFVG
jgi:DNA-binding MarR family transcriptional regulator